MRGYTSGMRGYTVQRRHSGTEDGPLWYVVDQNGEPTDNGGWLNKEDAEHDAAHLNGEPCPCDEERARALTYEEREAAITRAIGIAPGETKRVEIGSDVWLLLHPDGEEIDEYTREPFGRWAGSPAVYGDEPDFPAGDEGETS